MLPPASRCWAHALRGLAHDVRHLRRRLGPLDAKLGGAFLERWLDWFSRSFRQGFRLPHLTRDARPAGLCDREGLRTLLESFDDPGFDPRRLARLVLAESGGVFFQTPSLPAVLAEVLLERGEYEDALAVLAAARDRFPEDFRLHQLTGLCWSRQGELTKALDWLQPLAERYEDDETLGITAGVYKRLWRQDEGRRDALEKAHRAYLRGWERSRRTCAYAGINAATTALWLGRPGEARRLAEEARQFLQKRANARATHDAGAASLYWDWVTRGETELLLGAWAAARRTYQTAFAAHREQRGNVRVSREQAARVLQGLGLSPGAAAQFFDRPSAEPGDGPSLAVGVTGHRTLPDEELLRHRLREALAASQARAGRIILLSALAEGADRLAARVALSDEIGGRLHVVLPLDPADYRRDFASEASREEFQSLLACAGRVIHPPTVSASRSSEGDDRIAAYAWAGHYVVDHADVLLALWDGELSRGLGGTAEVVAYARQVGRPLIWIRTQPPGAVTWERVEGHGDQPAT